jgi:hypothetical protein
MEDFRRWPAIWPRSQMSLLRQRSATFAERSAQAVHQSQEASSDPIRSPSLMLSKELSCLIFAITARRSAARGSRFEVRGSRFEVRG